MKRVANWSELSAKVGDANAHPVRSLREQDGFLQFFDKSREELAVNRRAPYGSLSGLNTPELMKVISEGDDYVVFDIPEDTLSLSAITLGTGNRNALLLRETYRRVGQTLGRVLRYSSAPFMGVADFAVIRPALDVVVVPPLEFGRGSSDIRDHAFALSDSVRETFDEFFREPDINMLSAAVIRGAMYEV